MNSSITALVRDDLQFFIKNVTGSPVFPCYTIWSHCQQHTRLILIKVEDDSTWKMNTFLCSDKWPLTSACSSVGLGHYYRLLSIFNKTGISDSSSALNLSTEKWWRLSSEWYTVLSNTVTSLPHLNRQLITPEYHFALSSRRKEVVSFIFSLHLLCRIRLGKSDNHPWHSPFCHQHTVYWKRKITGNTDRMNFK